MKLTKDDIGRMWFDDIGVSGIPLYRLREVVKELSSRRQGDEYGHAWIMERDIYDLFGEILEEREV